MTPLTLELIGFRGIRDGLKKRELFLDFRQLPKGLIALVGPNGKGKSTVLNNMHPYRLMPSGKGKNSPSSFSFFDGHLLDGKCAKILTWESKNGVVFKSEFLFTTKTRKTECYLFSLVGDDWVRYRSDKLEIEIDGKTDVYDRCVEEILGSPEVFFASRFLGQGRQYISALDHGDVKALMAEMLNVDHYRVLGKKANDVVGILSGELARLQTETSNHERLVLHRQALTNDLVQSTILLERLKQEKTLKECEIRNTELSKLSVEKDIESNKSNLVKRQELHLKRTGANERLAALLRKQAADLKKNDDEIALYEKQITSYHRQLERRAVIDNAVKSKDKLEADIKEAEVAVVNARKNWQSLAELKSALDVKTNALKNTIDNGVQKAATIKVLTEQSSLIDTVPCKTMTMNKKCPLLANAHAAGEQIPIHMAARASFIEQYRTTEKAIAGLNESLKVQGDVKLALDLAESQLGTLRKEFAQVVLLCGAAGEIKAAEENLANTVLMFEERKKQREEIVAQADFDKHGLEVELAVLEKELQSINCLDQSLELDKLVKQIVTLRAEYRSLEGRCENEIRSQSRLISEIAGNDSKIEMLDQMVAMVRSLSDEIAVWRQLVVAFGNSGLLALCIDDAGPRIAHFVNQLLCCYGTDYSVEIVTQIDVAKGGTKEGFTIVVHDAENNATKDIDNVSGGQKVWLNDSISRGISLYLNETGEDTCSTLFSDETDGQLDLRKKRDFMAMKRLVLEMSGCDREFFISHTQDCIDMANHVIDFEKLAIIS